MRTKFMHLRHKHVVEGKEEVSPNGGMTVAYIEDQGTVIGFAPAKCHTRDNYNKHQGRVKAEGRLKSPAYFTEVKLTEQDFFKQMQQYWQENSTGQKTPACCSTRCNC